MDMDKLNLAELVEAEERDINLQFLNGIVQSLTYCQNKYGRPYNLQPYLQKVDEVRQNIRESIFSKYEHMEKIVRPVKVKSKLKLKLIQL